MDGPEVFRRAVRVMVDSARAALEHANVSADDIAMFVPHQANTRIIASACKRLGIGADRTANNLASVGNTSPASLPLAIAEVADDGHLQPGVHTPVVGFGACVYWASARLALAEWRSAVVGKVGYVRVDAGGRPIIKK